MTFKAIVTAAAAAVVLACAASPAPAQADAWTTVNGVQVRVATALTVFEAGDDRLDLRRGRELEIASVEFN